MKNKTDKKCPNCGYANEKERVYCKKCGLPFVSKTKTKYYKPTEDVMLARYLLEFIQIEYVFRRNNKTVSSNILLQYFADDELKKRYPRKKIKQVINQLVQAGLIKEVVFG